MTRNDQEARPIFALEPRGPELSPHMIGTLAQGGGPLVGAIVNGSVQTWLADGNGQLTLVMWPGNFRARFYPLEVIDRHGDVFARADISRRWRAATSSQPILARWAPDRSSQRDRRLKPTTASDNG